MKIIHIKTSDSKTNSQVNVSNELIDQPNPSLLAQAIRVYLGNQRQGTSKTKTRSEVKMTTRKSYRQKGTGNARHGAQDAPIFVGGGIAHGPTGQENWKRSLTKTLRSKALAAAMTAQSSNIFINDELLTLSGKTQEAIKLLEKIVKAIKDEKFQLAKSRLLIVTEDKSQEMERALRNIPNIELLSARTLNALAIVRAHKILLTSEATKQLEQRVASVGGKSK